jgi:rhodanese-related sulfurtransferase
MLKTTYTDLSFVDYRSEFFETADHTLVDVRTTGEFTSGRIPGAVNIPLDQLQRRLDEIPAGRPVVVVCASGNRSQDGAHVIANAGHTAYNLQGGTMVWMMNGLPLER